MDPKSLTPEEATRIARHHLGDTLHRCYRGGAHADLWCVEAVYQGSYQLGCAPTPEAAAAAVATQLRAAGWVPTHARLEWERFKGTSSYGLFLRLDGYKRQLLGVVQHHGSEWGVYDEEEETWTYAPFADLQTAIGWWHAATLPSLHLPPFPTDGK